MLGLTAIALSIFTIISLCALGGVFSEKSGVINVGLEGMMASGALGFAISGALLHSISNNFQFVSLIIAALCGGFIALLHAFVCVTLRGNQVISGIAINMLIGGISLFIINGIKIGDYVGSISTGYIAIKLSADGLFNKVNVMIIICIILLIVAYILLNKTKLGIRIKSVGENPSAVASLGISVNQTRYVAILLSGIFSGIAGGMFMVLFPSYNGSVQGYGFIALAIMIFGQWKIKLSILGALLFSVFNGLALQAPFLSLGYVSSISSDLLNMLPFIMSLLALMINSKKSQAPKAIGQPYKQTK